MHESLLVRRLQQGDVSALDPLYTAYSKAASRTAYLITYSHTAAEDAVHDAFVEVLRNVSALRNPDHFRAWFYRIVINKAKRQVRPHSVHLVPLDLDHHEMADQSLVPPDEAVLATEEVSLLWEAVEGLDEMYRIPIVLRYYTRLSDVEIAETMEVPVGTVKSRLSYARKLLHQQLSSGCMGEPLAKGGK